MRDLRYARAVVDLDAIETELRGRDYAFVHLSALWEVPEEDRVLAARRIFRQAGKRLGAKVRTQHRPDDAVRGYIHRETPIGAVLKWSALRSTAGAALEP